MKTYTLIGIDGNATKFDSRIAGWAQLETQSAVAACSLMLAFPGLSPGKPPSCRPRFL
jgi:hypothetical protein